VIAITKRVEFDAGHRVPDHASKCANPHGHRYVVEAEISGPVIDQAGDPENGMVVDFGRLKALLVERVHDRWDHGFLVAESDTDLGEFLRSRGFKVDTLPVPPTAENLAAIIAFSLDIAGQMPGCRLTRLTVWETPTCSASWLALP